MQNKRSLLGDAPRLLVIVGPALVIAVVATLVFPGIGSFSLRFRGPLVVLAIWLAALGIPFWISAAFELVSAWNKKRIATRGAFGLCRHPIFAVWIWFVLPIVAILADSWFFLAADVVFLVASVLGARAEEAAMAEEFGDAYREYARRTRMLVPIPRIVPVTGRRFLRGLVQAVAGVVYLGAVFVLIAVPIGRGLGATAAERVMQLPGDELAPAPEISYTQAITIQAPPAEVWSWLVQVGYGKAGWYNFDGINRMASPDYFIDGNGSSRQIHPELQDLKVGDGVGLVPVLIFDVVALEKNAYFVITKGPEAGADRNAPDYMNAVWTFSLIPQGESSTRLLVRYRTEMNGGFGKNFWNYFFNYCGGALLQQPAMLQGVKMRAEKRI